MKVSKLPGFGSFGAIVEDFEWDQPGAYQELKEINLKSLLTVVKGNGSDNFPNLVKHAPDNLITRRPYRLVIKYGTPNFQELMTPAEQQALRHSAAMSLGNHAPGWHRVTGKRTDDGRPMGAFGETELGWHSNEFMTYEFQPLVMLYGAQHMSSSATSFIQTADWYDSQSESFKSELNELVSICELNPRLVVPTIREEDLAVETASRPSSMRVPFVLDSPAGIRGIHYSLFVSRFEGMSQEDSDKILNKFKKELFDTDGNEFPWWWHDDHTLLMFDNTITLHRRIFQDGVDIAKRLDDRLGYRIAADYAGHEDYNGFLLSEFRAYKQEIIDKIDRLKSV